MKCIFGFLFLCGFITSSKVILISKRIKKTTQYSFPLLGCSNARANANDEEGGDGMRS